MDQGEDSASSLETISAKPISVTQKEIYHTLEIFKTQVNRTAYIIFIHGSLKAYLVSKADSFRAGQLATCNEEWQNITSDQDILTTIPGEKIDFVGCPPIQHSTPYSNVLPQDQLHLIKQEIESLLQK